MDNASDKIGQFFENHAQWIALGIGGIILLWAVWAYVLSPGHLRYEVDGRVVGPGGVDPELRRGPAQQLEQAIQQRGRAPQYPEPNFPAIFNRYLALADDPPQIASAVMPVTPLDLQRTGVDADLPGVEELPSAPPAVITSLHSGRAYARVPVQSPQLPGERAGGDRGEARVFALNQQDINGFEDPDAQWPGGVEMGPTVTQDLVYNRINFEIDPVAIRERFRRAGFPSRAQRTAILDVQLVRERQLPDGTWGETTTVPVLRNNPRPQMPGNDAGMDAKIRYASLASDLPQWVYQPPFYEVQAGDDPEERLAGMEFPPDDPQDQPPMDDRNGRDPGMNGDMPVPDDDFRVNRFMQPPRGDGRGDGRGAPPPDAGFPAQPDERDARSPQQRPAQPPTGQPGDEPRPRAISFPGDFDVTERSEPIRGWAYDETSVPGETYRYRVQYALRNPVFQVPRVAADPRLEEVLFLASDASEGDWSDPIEVQPLTYYFLAGMTPAAEEAQFRVFRWQRGQWREQRFRLNPGDPVGREQNGIDFRTGVTLVDVRRDPATNNFIALIMDGEGRFIRRSQPIDSQDPKLRELEREMTPVAGR